MGKIRLDQLLVERGFAPTRAKALALVMSGRVFSEGRKLEKGGTSIGEDIPLEVRDNDRPFVSRGGEKLVHAIKHFGVEIEGKQAIDVGASTGGFTDCLLKNGAAEVTAVDVGTGQLDWNLRNDPRVKVMEKFNAREISPEKAGGPYDIAVIDVSFISLELVLKPVASVVREAGLILPLVKPQFEAGREEVSKGRGVIRNPKTQEKTVKKITLYGESIGLEPIGSVESPITGPKGNREFFILFKKR
jgi:23S rRNA (cytidine1920-2'-O)/16S rRNA (cytidine1409-2'-O)-methyltransferase